ncbi:glutamate decarboxylase [Cystobasidium minutum MCA 4210]|uniref:glutamate decarboxylase n=1 Tax=Cystobasidium minutum MCA 4210 TaxID=1397322 RepID=UPI0034CEDEEA|eukprot:jgi/Rhomi1/186238/estExt_fgenesh1_pm.C_50150
MSLRSHVHTDKVLAAAREHPAHRLTAEVRESNLGETTGAYAGRYTTEPVPKYKLPTHGTNAQAAYQLIHDQLSLDGTPLLNLASFVHTFMPPEADKLMQENVSKNLCDEDEYPMMVNIHTRCISMLASLWKAPHSSNALGTCTTGSSEAIMLGGLAAKKRWQAKMKAAGKDIHNPGPNVVMGANAQVAIEKFARYFDVETRLVPVDESTRYCMSPDRAMEYVDENTICVFVILGSTYTGHYENVQRMDELLTKYEKETGIHVPIHVDAASGGFVAPFAHPSLKWNFEIERVESINTSGHKFGLAYVGVGWVIFRDRAMLPKELIFELHYLGSTEYSFNLNFSRPAAPMIGQYFNFINLGYEGYRRIAMNDLANARLLSRALEKSTYFKCISEIHKGPDGSDVPQDKRGDPSSYAPGLPVVAYTFSDAFKKKYPDIQQNWIQTLLRARGWISPNYALPPNAQNTEVLRVVVRENFSEELLDLYLSDLIAITEGLMKSDSSSARLAMLGSKKRHESTEAAAGHSGHKEGDAIKTHTYSRQC